MTYAINGLPAESFIPHHGASDAALAAHGICRVQADTMPGFPCRVSLHDAAPGEMVLLLPFEHHPVATPYRASGPIYVRENAVTTAVYRNRVPPFLDQRRLSLRAYDAAGWMQTADVIVGTEAFESAIEGLFACDEIAYVHVHNAAYGCYMCRVDRT